MKTVWLVQQQTALDIWLIVEIPSLAPLRQLRRLLSARVDYLGSSSVFPRAHWVNAESGMLEQEESAQLEEVAQTLEKHPWALSREEPRWAGKELATGATVVLERPWFHFTHREGYSSNLIPWRPFLIEYNKLTC